MKNPFARKGNPTTKLASVTVNIPWVGNCTLTPDEGEVRAAWALYVELSTRVASQPVHPKYGSLHEALDSVYALFGETRRVLGQSGPGIAHGRDSLAPLVIGVLNTGLRPFLTKWHAELNAYELTRDARVSALQHERDWPYFKDFMQELKALQVNLDTYRTALLTISGASLT